MKKLTLLFCALILTACVSQRDIKGGLDTLVNLPMDKVAEKIGYPDQDMTMAGKKIYIYHSEKLIWVDRSTNVRDNNGNTVYLNQRVPLTARCRVILEVDTNDVVTVATFEGDQEACVGLADLAPGRQSIPSK